MTTALSSETVTAAAIISEQRFLQWLDTAKPSQTLTYHLGGLLVGSRARSPDRSSWACRMGAHQAGKVTLTQRRIAPKICDYLATRKGQP